MMRSSPVGEPRLVILPTVEARPLDESAVELPQKLVDGAAGFASRWPGPVVLRMWRRHQADMNLDNRPFSYGDLPFRLQWNDDPDFVFQDRRSVVMGAFDPRHLPVLQVCAAQGCATVVVAETTLRTRLQSIDAQTKSLVRRLRRKLWSTGFDRRCRALLPRLGGLQCNGLPAYAALSGLNANALLFYDTRAHRQMLATQDERRRRAMRLGRGGPLRLVYSGQLKRIKGVQHIPAFARELKRLDVPFRCELFGDGYLRADLEREIAASGLGANVVFRGTVPFSSELMPRVASEADLFICPHVQGDPSCTYLETMACGVPIAGFANEALAALSEVCRGVLPSPVSRPKELAMLVARLHRQRAALIAAADAAFRFAESRTFETVMDDRIRHLLATLERRRTQPCPST